MPRALLGHGACRLVRRSFLLVRVSRLSSQRSRSRFPDVPRLCSSRDKPTARRGFQTSAVQPAPKCSKPWSYSWVFREPRPSKRRVRSLNRITHPLFSAPVLNRWFRQSRRLSLSAMRPRQAVSSIVPADELPRRPRAGRANWLHIILVAAGIALGSSVAGALVYEWYFDAVIVGLSSSLQPFSDAFHQLGASHITHGSPAPGN